MKTIAVDVMIAQVANGLVQARRVQNEATIVPLAFVWALFRSAIPFRRQGDVLDEHIKQATDNLVATADLDGPEAAAFHAICAYRWLVDYLLDDSGALDIIQIHVEAVGRVVREIDEKGATP